MTASEAPAHELIIVPASGEEREKLRQQCYDVRVDVFHHEQGFPLDTEFDEYDETATHFLLRLTAPDLGKANLRLAILKDYRKYGWGRELVEAHREWVRLDATKMEEPASNEAVIVCHSQIPVKKFYAKLGYEPEGEEFDEDGAPHQRMVMRIPLSA